MVQAGDSGCSLPLLWSFNRDGEAMSGLVESRDWKMKLDTAQARQQRSDLQSLAKPQSGMDDLKDKFARPPAIFLV